MAATSGTIIEWYDLFVYGSLVVVLANVFFPTGDQFVSLLYSLAAFVAGAAVRPLGGMFFGRLGDTVGRKYTFLLTITVMGTCTVLIGLLPTYSKIGLLAPLALVSLRLIQGLALGGEYAGAAIHVAENVPDDKRGYWTSYIQVTATLGLLLSTSVVLLARFNLDQTSFDEWGWRIPFLLSSVLLGIAITIRWRLKETKLFSRIVDLNKTTTHPLRDSIGNRRNLKHILAALIIVSGASVVWHTAQWYSLIFMQSILGMDLFSSSIVMVVAISAGVPFFIFFGWLSDKVGRLKVIVLGCILASTSFYPVYLGMKFFSDPPNLPILTGLVFLQILFSSMCYGPLAAFLIERFPARIRYTSVSVSYGIGTGDVGDATLFVVPAIIFATGSIYAGLGWSIIIPLATFIIAIFCIKETKTSIWSEVNENPDKAP